MSQLSSKLVLSFGLLFANEHDGRIREEMRHNGILCYDVDAEFFELRVDGRVWFRDESFPVVDLAVDIWPWLKGLKRGELSSYTIEPTGYGEPIMQLALIGERFTLKSPNGYGEFEFTGRLEGAELLERWTQFVEDVRSATIATFGAEYPWVESWLAATLR